MWDLFKPKPIKYEKVLHDPVERIVFVPSGRYYFYVRGENELFLHDVLINESRIFVDVPEGKSMWIEALRADDLELRQVSIHIHSAKDIG